MKNEHCTYSNNLQWIFFQDKNNEIDKEELRDLFTDMFPNFNR